MKYDPHNVNAANDPKIFEDEEILSIFSMYTILTGDSFVPEKMEIRDSKSKERTPNEDTRRLVFLGKDRLHYKVFKYPIQPPHKLANEDTLMS